MGQMLEELHSRSGQWNMDWNRKPLIFKLLRDDLVEGVGSATMPGTSGGKRAITSMRAQVRDLEAQPRG